MDNFKGRKYDNKDKYSIEEYGQKMVGKTFQELIDMDPDNHIIREPEAVYNAGHEDKKRKGGLGQIVEERFFHYKANSDSNADFKDAGVELKVTPYKINKNKKISAKERLVLSMIDYNTVINETDFESSHFWSKNQLILLVYYLWLSQIKNRLFYRIDYVRLFTPTKEDLAIIKQDYQKIVKKIQDGKAHELSESDTLYLSACPKALDSSVRRSQPNSDILAKPRAFAYKNSYMTYVLNNYIVGNKPEYERIAQGEVIDDLESYVVNQIAKYKGKTQDELCDILGVDKTKKPKNLGAMLAFRMLNVKGNNAEEFVKANIVVKTIRIGKNGKIKEHMSFPTFKFTDLVNEEWEESDFYNLLSSTKFLFVVYQENEKGEFELDHAQFWNMPYEDLDNEVRGVWEKTKEVLNNLPEKIHDGNHYISIFPTQSQNRVSHVRPHGRDSKDTYKLPDGRDYPKQCFWLNNSYILSIVKKGGF